MLDVIGAPLDEALIAAWRARVIRVAAALHWPAPSVVVRRHAAGVSLALVAPYDQLFLATEVNEWALCASLFERDPQHWHLLESLLTTQALEISADSGNPAGTIAPVIEESAALSRFERLAALEANVKLRGLLDAATARGLPYVADEIELTLGSGSGGRTYTMTELPQVENVPWFQLKDVPTAIVTGSNGKTTTVRLLAACARAHGWHAAYNCTDGVFMDDEQLASGDYSGPAGARRVLREPRAEAAILETARGGILRRGIAVSQANTAVVTNVSPDHFGEYGIDDLAGLAETKLSVAAAVIPTGLLVLNADDAQLRTQVGDLQRRFGRVPPLGWFSAGSISASLRDHGLAGVASCGERDGRLMLKHRSIEHDLGPILSMPLTMGGIATYNIANLAGAALAAAALGIEPKAIAGVFARFGADLKDNPGRMMQFERNGVKILLDYAHNPDGLRGFLTVADHLRSATGRLGLLLGQAGNRKDADIEELAEVAASFRPDLVVVKEDEAHLRGRSASEVPRIIRAALMRFGMSEAALPVMNNEVDAARYALDWARPGDVLALPVHSASARTTVVALLQSKD